MKSAAIVATETIRVGDKINLMVAKPFIIVTKHIGIRYQKNLQIIIFKVKRDDKIYLQYS